MVLKPSSSWIQEQETHHDSNHVLITEFLTGSSKATIEHLVEEYNTIAVSPNDRRWYRLLELRNGLRCMLVTNNMHDDDDEQDDDEPSDGDNTDDKLASSDAEEAFVQYHLTTVALSIPAGSLSDPSDLPGLAHLTEHLLFSGSTKYPEHNCLDTFIAYHGGTIHAYAELEFTVIVIEISSNRIVEALDILIHSLCDPLMSSETIHDQLQTIDDECSIAQVNDHYRATRLLGHLAKVNHPMKQFSWGNKNSLSALMENPTGTDRLKKFVKDRYCIPEGMNLVMISNDSYRIMQQRIESLFCLMKRSFKTLPDYHGLPSPWSTDDFQKFHLGTVASTQRSIQFMFLFPHKESKELFSMAQSILELGPVPAILLPVLRATQLPMRESVVKVASYQSNDCATYMLIFFEHGPASIRDYVLLEIIAETLQESLDDYLQSAGANHFSSYTTLREIYGVVSLQIELQVLSSDKTHLHGHVVFPRTFSSELYNSRDVLDYVSKFFVLFKDLIVETTKVDFDRVATMFRNAKQTVDPSMQALVDRYWTEIVLNSLVFDRNQQEQAALDTLAASDMQDWYNVRVIGSTRRQLILIVCSNDEIPPTPTGIVSNEVVSPIPYENQNRRFSMRPSERLPRLGRRAETTADENDAQLPSLQPKNDSKLRCTTTKRKPHEELRPTKSEVLQLNQPFRYPDEEMKLDYILKSFESIEITDEESRRQTRQSLRLVLESDSASSEKTHVSVQNLKQFKESCLLYNVTFIK